jgi:hypothetical protein
MTGRLRSGIIEEFEDELLDFLFLGTIFLASLFYWNNCLFA